MNFISKASSSMLLPFITITYAQSFGVFIAGILVAFTSVCQIFFNLLGGQITEKYGRIPIMKYGEWCKLLSFLILLFSSNPWVLFLSITIISCAQGIINPAIDSMLIDENSLEIKTKILTINSWIYNTSYLIGAMIGGWLFEDYFILIIIFLILSSLFVIFNIYKNMSETLISNFNSKKMVPFFSSYKKVLANTRFVLYSIGTLCYLILQRALTNYVAVSFKPSAIPFTSIELDNSQLLSLVLTINTLLVILFLPIISHKFTVKSTKRYLIGALILVPFGFFLLAYSTNFSLIIIATISFTFGELLFTPSSQAVFISLVSNHSKGPYNATLSVFQSCSKILSAFFLSMSSMFNRIENAFLLFLIGVLSIVFILLSCNKSKTFYSKKNGSSL